MRQALVDAHEDEALDDPQELDLQWARAQDESDVDDTVACSHCGHEMHWSAPKCPSCGQWVSDGYSVAAARSRRWGWAMVVAILVAVILVIWHGLGR